MNTSNLNIQISGKQMEVGQAMQTHIRTRLTELCGKYFDAPSKPLDANVIVHKQNNGAFTFVQITLNIGMRGGLVIKGEHRDTEPYAAFDAAANHIVTQLKRYKDRLKEHQHNLSVGDAAAFLVRERVFAIDDVPEEETASAENPAGYPLVIAESRQHVETMSVRDAVMRMDLASNTVFVFRNVQNQHLNVVYRRPDGNIGWIDSDDSKAA